MSAVLTAAPTPVSTPQPMSAAIVIGTSLGIFTTQMAGEIISVANVPHIPIRCKRRAVRREAGGAVEHPACAASPFFSHRYPAPRLHM